MRNLAIYGAGGLGREMLLMVRQINEQSAVWTIAGFYDDARPRGSIVDGVEVVGNFADLEKSKNPVNIIVPIADSAVRARIVSSITATHISFPSLFHQSANTGDPGNIFGKGCLITANTVFTTGIVAGDFVIVNLSCTIGHDVRIGNFASLMPGCHISGNVTIGEGAFIGTGAVVRQGISIGSGAIVGAGAVVTRDVVAGEVVVGVPARRMNRRDVK